MQGRPGDTATAKRSDHEHPARRCVLLCPATGEPLTQELLRALHKRGLTVVLVTDTPRAMLELAKYGAMALIVAEPQRMRGAGELVEAVRAYRPRTVCWQYTNRKLAPINGHLAGVRLAEPAGSTEDRLREDHERLAELVVHAQPREREEGEPLISEDELAMLLGPMPELEEEESK